MSETHGGPQVELMLSLGMRHPQGSMHHVHRLLHTGHGITEHLCTGSGHVRIGTHGLSLSSPGCDPTLGNSWGNSNDLDNITGSVGPLLLQKQQLRPRWQIFERETWARSWQCTGSRHMISSEEDSPGCRFNILWSSSQVRELDLQEIFIWEYSARSTSLCVRESENWAWLWMISDVASFNRRPRSWLWTSSLFGRSLFRQSAIVPSLLLLILRPLRADTTGRITINAMRFNWEPQMILLVRSMRSDQKLWCRACCCCECVLKEKLILWMAGRRKGILERGN